MQLRKAPAAVAPPGAGDVPGFLVDLARRAGGPLDLPSLLERTTRAVVELLGFRVAVLHLVTPGGDLEAVAVAGPPELRDRLLGARTPARSWCQLLEAARPQGLLLVAEGGAALPDGLLAPDPDLMALDPTHTGHPPDGLLAPLHGSDGELLGVLSVGLPGDGVTTDDGRRQMLELVAVQASLALDNARVHDRLRRSQQVLARSFDHAPVGMALFGPDRRVERANRAYCAFLGRSQDEVLGRLASDFSHPDDLALTQALSEQVRHRAGHVSRVEKRYLRPDGTAAWGRLTLTWLEDEDGRPEVLAHLEDVTDARAAAAELERRATTDPLTGLANRSTFVTLLDERLRDGQARTAVLYCDVDRFKVVNDTLGHGVGDDVLVAVARALTSVLRDGDLAARLGGDEFVVLLAGLAGEEEALAVAHRVHAATRRVVSAGDRSVVTSLSVGVAVDDGGDAASLLGRADAALYRAKEAGRDRVGLAPARPLAG